MTQLQHREADPEQIPLYLVRVVPRLGRVVHDLVTFLAREAAVERPVAGAEGGRARRDVEVVGEDGEDGAELETEEADAGFGVVVT